MFYILLLYNEIKKCLDTYCKKLGVADTKQENTGTYMHMYD